MHFTSNQYNLRKVFLSWSQRLWMRSTIKLRMLMRGVNIRMETMVVETMMVETMMVETMMVETMVAKAMVVVRVEKLMKIWSPPTKLSGLVRFARSDLQQLIF